MSNKLPQIYMGAASYWHDRMMKLKTKESINDWLNYCEKILRSFKFNGGGDHLDNRKKRDLA